MKDNELNDMDKLLKELKPPEVKAGEHKKALKSAATYSFLAASNKKSTFPVFIKLGLAFASVLMFAGISYAILQSVDSQGSETVQTNTNDEQGTNDSPMIDEGADDSEPLNELEVVQPEVEVSLAKIGMEIALPLDWVIDSTQENFDSGYIISSENNDIQIHINQFTGPVGYGCPIEDETLLPEYLLSLKSRSRSGKDIVGIVDVQDSLDFDSASLVVIDKFTSKAKVGQTYMSCSRIENGPFGRHIGTPVNDVGDLELNESGFVLTTISAVSKTETLREQLVSGSDDIDQVVDILESLDFSTDYQDEGHALDNWRYEKVSVGKATLSSNDSSEKIVIFLNGFDQQDIEADVYWEISPVYESISEGVMDVAFVNEDYESVNCGDLAESSGITDYVCTDGDGKLTIVAQTTPTDQPINTLKIEYTNNAWNGDDSVIDEIRLLFDSIEINVKTFDLVLSSSS